MKRLTERFGPDSAITQAWIASSCIGKQAFDTPQQASRAARKRRNLGGTYRCKSCGKFHCFSKERRK